MTEKKKSDNTGTLMKKLFTANNLDSFIKQNNDVMLEVSLIEHLKKLCEERKTVPERVILKAQIDRVYGHQIFKGTRKPSRDKVLQLAFGFDLDVEETQMLLRVAGKSTLYPKLRRDAIIIFALKNKLNISDVQELLYDYNLTLLGDMKNE